MLSHRLLEIVILCQCIKIHLPCKTAVSIEKRIFKQSKSNKFFSEYHLVGHFKTALLTPLEMFIPSKHKIEKELRN
jgi:hypothetical protein